MSTGRPRLEELSEIRQAILTLVKREGTATIGQLAEELRVSYEAARQQVGLMTREGWLEKWVERRSPAGPGRPTRSYRLTAAGDHLFPKHYDLLSVELIDAVVDRMGVAGLRGILSDLTDARVRQWAPQLKGLSLEERVEALKGIYLAEDPFMTTSKGEDGQLRLIEHNCPFLNVAHRRPALCSLTVSTLSRLLGYRVLREKRFQDGDGRCVFRVLSDRPLGPDEFRFEFEESVNQE